MARTTNKDKRSIYYKAREKLDLTREEASELTGLEPYRIERIENEKMEPDPWDVVTMSKAYKLPELCNHYCANECPIGRKYVPEVKPRDLASVILEMLASLNSMQKRQERLIEITADGIIQNEELKDFIHIQKELERISLTVESLQLWTERMMATGKIDIKAYNKLIDR